VPAVPSSSGGCLCSLGRRYGALDLAVERLVPVVQQLGELDAPLAVPPD
jgi:hypothetical protein